ncbi:putative d-amino acid oxidase [Schistosoma mansoni]|uniref:putative d-amino acid oxidase n=1 Tax=Schistosoma mansoni TaxID=6183 RepID=UPI0001A62D51|nr:putative d-amino acid oxidase [Schistosoma mansoni]|eukprot:XP_018649615.1 putative d-amino acid oxidase [Schistosoma mansoni]
MKVGIIGSGIIGLSTALAIQENYPNLELIIQADKKDVMVTSYGAAGIFRPDPKLLPRSNDDDSFIHWCHLGHEQYWKLACSWDSSEAGVYFHPTYQLSEYYEFDIPFITYYYTTCIIEPRYYMNYLLKKLTKLIPNDHSIYSERMTRFTSSNELYNWAKEQKINVIVNCTGLGSGYLFNDPELRPVKGQLVRVQAPWMKFGFYFGVSKCNYIYILCSMFVVGGLCSSTRSDRHDDTIVSSESTKNILQRIDNTWYGGLGQSSIVEEWTGLRPFRPSIRLEIDWYQPEITCQPLPIIHNYGHGSMGVALSWGTAIDAVKLFENVLKSSGTIHS